MSEEARKYRKLVRSLALLWRQPCLKSRLSVEILAYPPDNRRRDIDNLIKITLDSLQHANLYLDDSQIDKLTIERRENKRGGNLAVSITEWGKNE